MGHGVQGYLEAIREAKQSGKLHVIMFVVSHCRSCKAAVPKFIQTVKEYPDVDYTIVNGEDGRVISQQLNVDNFPAFRFFMRSSTGEIGLLDEFICGGFECARRVRKRLDRFTEPSFSIDEYSF